MSEIKRRSATPEPRFPCLPSLGEHCGECHRCTPVDEGRTTSRSEGTEMSGDRHFTAEEIERIRRTPLTPAMLDTLERWRAEGYDLDTPAPPSDFAAVPQGTWTGASRYDTDDQHVLSLWREDGSTFDLRRPRSAS